MIPQDNIDKIKELDRILEVCNSKEGRHLLDELKELDFYKKLQEGETISHGPLTFLANMAMDASEKSFRLECEIDETRAVLKEVIGMLEQQLYNKGDNSPSENTVISEINTMRSRHSFLY